jgi:hypothetical protein
MKPFAIDLFCGLGGWAEGLLSEGYDVVGFDIEHHVYGEHRYPAQLVIQDVLTLHGSQFKDATLVVASPPCQFFSYCAMPWARAKSLAAEVRSDPVKLAKELALFNACFRIQREASEAAGRHVPMVVENVRGAQPWVGRSRWNYGSFHFWGDVPALMPMTLGIPKVGGLGWSKHGTPGYKAQGFNVTAAQRFREGSKGVPHRPTGHWTNPAENGIKCGGDWFNAEQPSISRMTSSKSDSRKAASAMIAKIPEPVARHIARTFRLVGELAPSPPPC